MSDEQVIAWVKSLAMLGNWLVMVAVWPLLVVLVYTLWISSRDGE